MAFPGAVSNYTGLEDFCSRQGGRMPEMRSAGDEEQV